MKKNKQRNMICMLSGVLAVVVIAVVMLVFKAESISARGRDTTGFNRRTSYYRDLSSDMLDQKGNDNESKELVSTEKAAGGTFEEDWKGLKVAWYGDSLTELYYHCDIVNRYFGFEGYNCGIRGSSVTNVNENPMCLQERMTQGDKAIPYDVDAIFIMAGTNDWCGNIPLGDKRLLFDVEGHIAVDNKTFYGACHEMFNNLTQLYPDAYILVMGAPFASANRFDIYNEQGLTTFDYGNALCEAAAMWGIPSFNIGELMGINVNNVDDSQALMYEGMHFVEGGARMAADVIIQEISGLKFYK